METYKKRIGFAISAQSLMIAGGIGQFTKGFCKMCDKLGYVVDIIVDQPLSVEKTDIVNYLEGVGNIYCPAFAKDYKVHQSVHMYADSVNFEKEANFRDAFMVALSKHIYDVMVCNVPESFIPWYSLGLSDHVPSIFYTHNEDFVGLDVKGGPYSKQYAKIYRQALYLGTRVGTQTRSNVMRMEGSFGTGTSTVVLRMPIYEDRLLEQYKDLKRGVLFIGRWEERKNPQEFIQIVEKLQDEFLVKIITNRTGATKFEKAMRTAGLSNYIIYSDVQGDDKADIIQSSKICINPSIKESFGYGAIETLGHCHVLFNGEYDWSREFSRTFKNVTRYNSIDEAVKTTQRIGRECCVVRGDIQQVQEYQAQAFVDWANMFDELSLTRKYGKSTQSRFGPPQSGYVRALNDLGRAPGVEDITSMYNALGNYTVQQSKYHTWISNEKSHMPENEAVSTGGNSTLDELFGVTL